LKTIVTREEVRPLSPKVAVLYRQVLYRQMKSLNKVLGAYRLSAL